jgi:hypothetical protein
VIELDIPTMALVVQTFGVVGTLTAATIAVQTYIKSTKRAEEAREKEQETLERELETRQAQLFMQVYNRFSEKDFVEAFNHIIYENPPVFKDVEEYDEKYVKNNPDYDRKVSQVAAYLEGIGVLVQRGLLDITLVDDLISSIVIMYWELLEPLFLAYRVRYDMPQLSEWVEYLYHRVKETADAQHKNQN